MDGMTINLKGTFGYEARQEQAKNDKGELLFSIGDTEVSAREVNGKLVFTDGKTGKEITGEYGADGKLIFKNQNGDEVYARLGKDKELRFDATADQAAEVGKVMTERLEKVDTEAVSFETSSDADKIVDAVKQMVEDYNAMAKEIKDAYSTLPAQRSNGAYYEPLTSEEEADASESFIKNWNEKAKQGVLFGDRDLASLYQRMTPRSASSGIRLRSNAARMLSA